MSTQDAAAGKARDAALQGALSQIERQFGKGTVMRMGDEGAQVKVNAIPTGALSLDLALGIGGVPRGRIVEIFGPESSGKTTLVYHVIAEAQKLGGGWADRKSTRLNSSHANISYAVFCLKKKNKKERAYLYMNNIS